MCGDQNEKLYDVEFLVPHNSPTVTVVMTSSLKENSGKAWGFRNFHIEYVACPNDCGICFANGECSQWEEYKFNWVKPKFTIEDW